jgi:hypothetical protein
VDEPEPDESPSGSETHSDVLKLLNAEGSESAPDFSSECDCTFTVKEDGACQHAEAADPNTPRKAEAVPSPARGPKDEAVDPDRQATIDKYQIKLELALQRLETEKKKRMRQDENRPRKPKIGSKPKELSSSSSSSSFPHTSSPPTTTTQQTTWTTSIQPRTSTRISTTRSTHTTSYTSSISSSSSSSTRPPATTHTASSPYSLSSDTSPDPKLIGFRQVATHRKAMAVADDDYESDWDSDVSGTIAEPKLEHKYGAPLGTKRKRVGQDRARPPERDRQRKGNRLPPRSPDSRRPVYPTFTSLRALRASELERAGNRHAQNAHKRMRTPKQVPHVNIDELGEWLTGQHLDNIAWRQVQGAAQAKVIGHWTWDRLVIVSLNTGGVIFKGPEHISSAATRSLRSFLGRDDPNLDNADDEHSDEEGDEDRRHR